jgi:cell division protein FtsB
LFRLVGLILLAICAVKMWTMQRYAITFTQQIFVTIDSTMRFFTIFKKIVTNRYLIALVAFGIWMLFFDRNNYIVQKERTAELQELNRKIGYYKQQIDATQKELEALQNDPNTLEKYAREKYFMKRANEEVFVVKPAK